MRIIGRSPNKRRSRRGERGQSAVEIGILLPLFLILILGVVEVNAAMNSYISVVNASRDGARLGTKGAATDAAIQALVQKDLERLPNNTPLSNITITRPTVAGTASVKVQACYDHSLLVGVRLVVPEDFRLCATTTMPQLN